MDTSDAENIWTVKNLCSFPQDIYKTMHYVDSAGNLSLIYISLSESSLLSVIVEQMDLKLIFSPKNNNCQWLSRLLQFNQIDLVNIPFDILFKIHIIVSQINDIEQFVVSREKITQILQEHISKHSNLNEDLYEIYETIFSYIYTAHTKLKRAVQHSISIILNISLDSLGYFYNKLIMLDSVQWNKLIFSKIFSNIILFESDLDELEILIQFILKFIKDDNEILKVFSLLHGVYFFKLLVNLRLNALKLSMFICKCTDLSILKTLKRVIETVDGQHFDSWLFIILYRLNECESMMRLKKTSNFEVPHIISNFLLNSNIVSEDSFYNLLYFLDIEIIIAISINFKDINKIILIDKFLTDKSNYFKINTKLKIAWNLMKQKNGFAETDSNANEQPQSPKVA